MSLARSASPNSPGYEDDELQQLRRSYGGPNGDDFDGETFTGLEGSEYEDAQKILDALKERRYKFSSPEMADMYFSALAGVYYHTIVNRKHRPPGCYSFSSKPGQNNAKELKNTYKRRKNTLGDVETCYQAFTRLHAVYTKLLEGAKGSATATSNKGASMLKDRLKKIEEYTTYRNLSELKRGKDAIAERGWTAAGGRRRATRRVRRGRKGTRKH